MSKSKKVLNPLTGKYIFAKNSTAHNKDLKKLLKKPCTDKRKNRSKITARCVYKDEFRGKSKFLKIKRKSKKTKRNPKQSPKKKSKKITKKKSNKKKSPKKKSKKTVKRKSKKTSKRKSNPKKSKHKSSRKVKSPRLRNEIDAFEYLDITEKLINKQKGFNYWLLRLSKLSKKYKLTEKLVHSMLNEFKKEY